MVVKLASSKEEFDQLKQLRIAVFVHEQGIPMALEMDDKDEISFHAVVMENSKILATGRLTPKENGLALLSRISVLESRRGEGLGVKVMHKLEEVAREQGFNTLQLFPHVFLEDFYQNMGYYTISDDEGLVGKHKLIKMEKRIP